MAGHDDSVEDRVCHRFFNLASDSSPLGSRWVQDKFLMRQERGLPGKLFGRAQDREPQRGWILEPGGVPQRRGNPGRRDFIPCGEFPEEICPAPYSGARFTRKRLPLGGGASGQGWFD